MSRKKFVHMNLMICLYFVWLLLIQLCNYTYLGRMKQVVCISHNTSIQVNSFMKSHLMYNLCSKQVYCTGTWYHYLRLQKLVCITDYNMNGFCTMCSKDQACAELRICIVNIVINSVDYEYDFNMFIQSMVGIIILSTKECTFRAGVYHIVNNLCSKVQPMFDTSKKARGMNLILLMGTNIIWICILIMCNE